MGFIIAGCILLFFLFLMLIWIKVSLVYNDGGAEISVKVLFFKITVVGKKKKDIDKNDFKIKKFRRRRKKAIIRHQKRLAKRQKKAESKNKTKKEAAKTKKKKASPKEMIGKILDIFGVFLKRFPRYLRVDCARLVIGVGGKDAAGVAVSYGAVVQSVQYVGTLLHNVTNFKAKKDAIVSVYPDFVSEKWTADINVVMRLRVIHIIKLGLAVLMRYIKIKLKGTKKAVKAPTEEKKAA